jgi:hypothetical protein
VDVRRYPHDSHRIGEAICLVKKRSLNRTRLNGQPGLTDLRRNVSVLLAEHVIDSVG